MYKFKNKTCNLTDRTKYDYLLELRASGELHTLVINGFLPVHFLTWMEIYQYHLEHPRLSQFQVALFFNVSKAKVWDAYLFMSETLTV